MSNAPLNSLRYTLDPSVPLSTTVQGIGALSAGLAEEMIERWRKGERPRAEEFLNRHPELWSAPEAAVDLIYEEICLHKEYGDATTPEEVIRRFPQWRAQLEVLLDCHRILEHQGDRSRFPGTGETWGDFTLLAHLGHGAQGSVFLATQPSLADRPLVLKLSPRTGREHLSLARLQHTAIVPLYSVVEDPSRDLRALCMPYFGGTTLAHLLSALADRPLAERTGRHLLDALDRAQKALPIVMSATGPARQVLGQATYVEAICWIAACLADALHYAHERGLVHLDVKPSNILLAADGQPMLLDFHLAQPPIQVDDAMPKWVGGTPPYMPPEQQAALLAVRDRKKITTVVDRRADIYALGAFLYEALGGVLPVLWTSPSFPNSSLGTSRLNPQVSIGLSDIIQKCLARNANDRYPTAALVAADLQRHLSNQPLQGVANRSLPERWRKWRRRRPSGLALAGMWLAVLTAAFAVGITVWTSLGRQMDEARNALAEGQQLLHEERYADAERTFRRGVTLTENLPWQGTLAGELANHLRLAERAHHKAERDQAVRDLHLFVDRLRFLYGVESLPARDLVSVEARCRTFWESRARIMERLGRTPSQPSPESGEGRVGVQQLHTDLLDLAILWVDFRVRLAEPNTDEARHEALRVFSQAEELFGPSLVLCLERRRHALALGLADVASEAERRASELRPRTAWEYYAVGRLHLRDGNLPMAAAAFERAVELQPQDLWANFYQGICAYRLRRFDDAIAAFSVCIGSAPQHAGCFYNRALAYTALGRTDRALHDYDRVLRLDPAFALAWLNRGTLHYQEKRHALALADLQKALETGVDAAVVHYNLALVHLERGDRDAALSNVQQALRHQSDHKAALELRDRLAR